ncbi:uncharacterized protein LOC131662885 isoform X2 [Phymastichus coffea]|uniref:uncharacterized protein LOC131662885 isoform X2 n=1 Tax=Phymastichus coffea TaxID=108790 RepID=UPI00273A841D|nr:uncharacterized protein LOC131662885 isoform X2 [Phymastichus coffea]
MLKFLLDEDDLRLIQKVKNDDAAGNIRIRRRAKRNSESLRERGSMFKFVSTSTDHTDAGDGSAKFRRLDRGRKETSNRRSNVDEISKKGMDLPINNSESSDDSSNVGSTNSNDDGRTTNILQTNNQEFCTMEEQRKVLRTLWNRAIREMGLKSRILHDVWEKPRSLEGKFFCQSLRNNNRNKRGVFIVAVHGEHLHVVHDCSYTNSQCRCGFMQKFAEQEAKQDTSEKEESKFQRDKNVIIRKQRRSAFGLQQLQEEAERDYQESIFTVFRERERTSATGGDNIRGRGNGQRQMRDSDNSTDEYEENNECKKFIVRWNRRRYASGLYDRNHWINLVFYLSQNGRQIHALQIGRETWIDGGKVRNLQIRRLFQEGKEGVVATSRISCDNGSTFNGPNCYRQGIQTGIDIEEHTENKERESYIPHPKPLKMESFFKSILCTPLKNILYTGHWINSKYSI